MERNKVEALFLLAGFDIKSLTELPDQYCGRPDASWWIVKTEHGDIEIGWRKRVISIEWSDTGLVYPLRMVREEERAYPPNIHVMVKNNTKWATGCHAYGYGEALQVLEGIKRKIPTAIYNRTHWAEHPPKPEDMKDWYISASKKSWVKEGKERVEVVVPAVDETHALEQFYKTEKIYAHPSVFLNELILAERAKHPEWYVNS